MSEYPTNPVMDEEELYTGDVVSFGGLTNSLPLAFGGPIEEVLVYASYASCGVSKPPVGCLPSNLEIYTAAV